MNAAAIAPALLERLGYAVFEDAGGGALTPVGELPAWFARAFGVHHARAAKFIPGDASPFLENFLPEAEAAWTAGGASRGAQSGAWMERGPGGDELALEAEAFLLDGRRILLLANHQERFDETARLLRTARTDKLGHERLLREIQTKEVLLHCIVHDLSQPLTALRGCLSLLGLGLPPEKMREVVEIADRQTRRQEGMIRDVLKVFASEMAALQSGASAAGVDAAKCAREVVEEYAAAFAGQGAALALDPRLGGGSAWLVVGEADRLRRLFTNFLENALRYSPAGTTVTVGIEEDGQFLRLFVDDQGPGLPEGVTAANLFRLFGKGKESTGKAGLGLYFCKITAERWGGGVGCENRASGGTRFWFRLPRVAGQPLAVAPEVPESGAEAKRKEPTASGAPREPAQSLRPLRILLADDLEINRQVTSELLAARGHKVTGVKNGRAAVEAVRQQDFDLVLMDVEMPGMDGLTAARAIRALAPSGARKMPILAMTAHDTPEDREQIRQAGMDGHLVKPFSSQALEQAVANALSETAAAPAQAAAALAESPCGTTSREALAARFGGDARLAASLARMFLKDSSRLLGAVRRAASRRNAEALARSAHALKGAVGHFGAPGAREAAARVEQLGRSGELRGVAGALNALTREVAELCALLAPVAGGKRGRRPGRPQAGRRGAKRLRRGRSRP
jgi:signal transduction histidine kinase/DNA-binding response OmpR family regulator